MSKGLKTVDIKVMKESMFIDSDFILRKCLYMANTPAIHMVVDSNNCTKIDDEITIANWIRDTRLENFLKPRTRIFSSRNLVLALRYIFSTPQRSKYIFTNSFFVYFSYGRLEMSLIGGLSLRCFCITKVYSKLVSTWVL